jgi:hypothetical protein
VRGYCGHSFYAPALSDFSYGQFIFTSNSGKYYAYLNALDDPVFLEVKRILKTTIPSFSGDALDDKVWHAFSKTCEVAPDSTLFEIGLNKCPRCFREKH